MMISMALRYDVAVLFIGANKGGLLVMINVRRKIIRLGFYGDVCLVAMLSSLNMQEKIISRGTCSAAEHITHGAPILPGYPILTPALW